VVLFDDAGLRSLMPRRLAHWIRSRRIGFAGDRAADALASGGSEIGGRNPGVTWHEAVRRIAVGMLATVVLIVSLVQVSGLFGVRPAWPSPVSGLYRLVAPFHSVNGYGLFAVMTAPRMEIVVEGSRDGTRWEAYRFHYKPGLEERRPGFVAPHQPRLDWQMWFAALGSYRNNPWLVALCRRLLEGSPEVVALMEHNPFPDRPPARIRAHYYEYRFTTIRERAATGRWWHASPRGMYLPEITLEDFTPVPSPAPRAGME
jgi:hypothetical protein